MKRPNKKKSKQGNYINEISNREGQHEGQTCLGELPPIKVLPTIKFENENIVDLVCCPNSAIQTK